MVLSQWSKCKSGCSAGCRGNTGWAECPDTELAQPAREGLEKETKVHPILSASPFLLFTFFLYLGSTTLIWNTSKCCSFHSLIKPEDLVHLGGQMHRDSNQPETHSARNLLLLQNYTGLDSWCSSRLCNPNLSSKLQSLGAGCCARFCTDFVAMPWGRTSTARSLHDSCSWAICNALLLYYSKARSLKCLRINQSPSDSQLFTTKPLYLMIISL